ncbi:MAG: GNAT family N-acetyltransferase [Lachnospiraceae bacterium]|nr:GNAT family N-acetyltransferase [Lachnospiraceae bacterium]
MIFETKQTEKAAVLFDGWQESLIWSCLQNVMGKLYVDSLESPVSAMIALGDFRFFAGKPHRELVLHQIETKEGQPAILVPQNGQWAELMEVCYREKAQKVTRYAIKKEPGIFDRANLQAAADSLPEGYVLKMIDEPLFNWSREMDWCRDWVAQYTDYAMYEKYGLGAVALKDGEPVAGASSYSGYLGGVEVEIVTREDHRRKGLAYACGAKLILECLKRGWYPSWDAKTKWSVALAEKLGYHFDHEYTAYEIW